MAPFKDLVDCFNGGAVIETRSGSDEKAVFRTVLQLDGDILTLVPKSHSPSRELIDAHWDAVAARMTVMARSTTRAIQIILMVLGAGLLIGLPLVAACGGVIDYSEPLQSLYAHSISLLVATAAYGGGMSSIGRRILAKYAMKILIALSRRYIRRVTANEIADAR
jgi:hypothetical protein